MKIEYIRKQLFSSLAVIKYKRNRNSAFFSMKYHFKREAGIIEVIQRFGEFHKEDR